MHTTHTDLDQATIDTITKEIHAHPALRHVNPATLRAALPAFLRSVGAHTPAGEPIPADEFVKHTCRDGRGPVFGRLTPDTCPRCAQLAAGAAPREAHPAIQAANRKREQEAADLAGQKRHYESGECAAKCGPMPTCYQW